MQTITNNSIPQTTQEFKRQAAHAAMLKRAARLYEDGYEIAILFEEAPASSMYRTRPALGKFIVTNAKCDDYFVDVLEQTCTCTAFAMTNKCKHLRGAWALANKQCNDVGYFYSDLRATRQGCRIIRDAMRLRDEMNRCVEIFQSRARASGVAL